MEEVLPWYIAGPLIGLIVPLLILLREIDSKAAMQIIIIKLNFLINFFN